MTKYLFLICSALAICSPMQAKKIDRLEKRVDFLEEKLHDSFHEIQYLRHRVEALEDKSYGSYEYSSSSTEEQTEGLASASDCDKP